MNQDVLDAPAAESALAEYTPTARALSALRARYANVAFDLATTQGNKAAREARRELVTLRTTLEARRKELKAPALERARLIDDEAKRLTREIKALEDPIDEQIAADERRRAAEAEAKRKAEQDRIDGHMAALGHIRTTPTRHISSDAAALARAIETWSGASFSAAEWQEFVPHADRARDEAIAALKTMHAAAVAREAEAARMAEQRAALEAEAAALAAQRAEQDRLAAEAAARQAEADQLAQAARDEADRQAAEARAAERAAMDAERVELAQARAAIEQATQPGASAPVAQGGVAGNPVQSQPVVSSFPVGDAAVGAGAQPEGVPAPSSTGCAAPDVTAAPSVSVVLEWVPVARPPETDQWGIALWIVSDEGPDDWQDWMAGKYVDAEFLLADDTKLHRGAVITHYAIVRGPFDA